MRTITTTTQRERILLVELLHAEYAHAHPTNGMRSLCVVFVIVLVIAAEGPGLNYIGDVQTLCGINHAHRFSKVQVNFDHVHLL